jgi:hypothetical protein
MKTAPWIFCCILFAVILLQQACPRKQLTTVPKSEYEAMKKAVVDTASYYEEIIKADDAAIDLATVQAEESALRARESEDKMTESQNVIDRLNAKIEAAKKEPPNTSFIPVSPNYINGCDSLVFATGLQRIIINQQKKDHAGLVTAKDQEIATRDKKLKDQASFNASLNVQLNNCLAKFKVKDSAKVKNQWFGEIGLMGNQVNPIGGGEIGITLINKRGVMYGVKGQILAGQAWVGIKTGFKLFQ